MATARQVAQLKIALALDDADQRDLAVTFLEHKIAVYIDTLADLADDYGYEYGRRIDLADDVIAALAAEASDHAASVVSTFNAEVQKLVDRNADQPRDVILDTYTAWAEDRADTHAPIISVTEAYAAHADATAAFFQAAGVEPDFDFGPHAPGEEHAECALCEMLEQLSPHPLSRVIEVGIPHINCRQSWQEVGVDPDAMPDEIQLGAATGGIVGGQPLVMRHGNDHSAAAAAVQGLVTGGAGSLGE